MFVLKNNFRRFLPIKIFHILVENILPPVVFYPSIIGYNMGKQLEVFDVIMSINTWVHTHTTHYTGATDCPCNVEFSLSLEVNCFKYLAQFSHQQVIWRENEQRIKFECSVELYFQTDNYGRISKCWPDQLHWTLQEGKQKFVMISNLPLEGEDGEI